MKETIGIHNPFKTEIKKKQFESVYDGIDTESPRVETPTITLDGGRYAINIKNSGTAREAAVQILKFIHELGPKDESRLAAYGIIKEKFSKEAPEEGCLLLRYDSLSISIYVGEDKSPESAYRRIGNAFLSLGKPELLKQHGITVTERM